MSPLPPIISLSVGFRPLNVLGGGGGGGGGGGNGKPKVDSLKKLLRYPVNFLMAHGSNWGYRITDFEFLAYICFIYIFPDKSHGYTGFILTSITTAVCLDLGG